MKSTFFCVIFHIYKIKTALWISSAIPFVMGNHIVVNRYNCWLNLIHLLFTPQQLEQTVRQAAEQARGLIGSANEATMGTVLHWSSSPFSSLSPTPDRANELRSARTEDMIPDWVAFIRALCRVYCGIFTFFNSLVYDSYLAGRRLRRGLIQAGAMPSPQDPERFSFWVRAPPLLSAGKIFHFWSYFSHRRGSAARHPVLHEADWEAGPSTLERHATGETLHPP